MLLGTYPHVTQALRYPVVIFVCEGLKASSTLSWLVEKSLTYRLYLRSLHHRYLSSQIKHNTRLVMAIPVPDLGLSSIARIVDCKICFNTSNHQRYELLALVRPKQRCIQWIVILYKRCVSTWDSLAAQDEILYIWPVWECSNCWECSNFLRTKTSNKVLYKESDYSTEL